MQPVAYKFLILLARIFYSCLLYIIYIVFLCREILKLTTDECSPKTLPNIICLPWEKIF